MKRNEVRMYGTMPSGVDMMPQQFREWNCVGIMGEIETKRPYTFQVGELPMVAWFQHSGHDTHPEIYATSTVNVCPHMGSKMDKGDVVMVPTAIHHQDFERGSKTFPVAHLQCPYHQMCHGPQNSFGSTKVAEGRLWWTCLPRTTEPTAAQVPPPPPPHPGMPLPRMSLPRMPPPRMPPPRMSLPRMKRGLRKRHTEYSRCDTPFSMVNSALFSMDFEYHHRRTMESCGAQHDVAFIPDIKSHIYNQTLALSVYCKLPPSHATRYEGGHTASYYLAHHHSSHTSLRVLLPNTGVCISVEYNFLPLGREETRWFITTRHNLAKGDSLREYLNTLGVIHRDTFTRSSTSPISPVDFAKDGPMKQAVMRQAVRDVHTSPHGAYFEDHAFTPVALRSPVLHRIRDNFRTYEFPDEFSASRLVTYYDVL